MENTPPSLLVVQINNQPRRYGRFWMISARSCFPNCQIFHRICFHLPYGHGQPFKTHLLISSYSSSFLPNPIFTSSSSFLGVFCFVEITSSTIMVMANETQFHVLAVDDSLIDRKLIERLLKTSSYQVTAVDSGSKALEFLGLNNNEDEQINSNLDYDEQRSKASVSPVVDQHHQEVEVSLIITDYCMPGMTGYDLLRKIKESSSFKDIPVVIMSSDNIPSRINRCLEDGAEEFFLKPVQLSDVNKLRPHLMKGRSKEMHPNINKRKGMEEIHSPDRTRTRYNELEVV
ncbi:hypothetical protein CRYUN_Cryun41cG0067800 [Craigia yunnanensis]